MTTELVIFQLFIIIILGRLCSSALTHVKFVTKPLCADTCVNVVLNTTNHLTRFECGVKCLRHSRCLGFSRSAPESLRSPDTCTLYDYSLASYEPCTSFRSGEVYYEKYKTCANGGLWRDERQDCDCTHTGGWVGGRCSEAPRSCYDLVLAGYPNGKVTISRSSVSSLGPETLRCDIKNYNKKVDTDILIYEDTTTPTFNASFTELENGIHQGLNYWVGLKHFHTELKAISDNPTPLTYYIFVYFYDYNGGKSVYYTYNGLKLGDATDGYNITHNGAGTGNSGYNPDDLRLVPSCFSDVLGVKFSTYDRDQDQVASENCALKSGYAGWYGTSCRPTCNPFGVFYDSSAPPNFAFAMPRSETTLWAGQFKRVKIFVKLEY